MIGFGGNASIKTGQIVIISTARQIPFPSNFAPYTGMEGARRKIRATDDVYIGPTSDVTAATGYLIPAGTEEDITARGPVWFVGRTGAGVSSSSSLSDVPTDGSSSSSPTEFVTLGLLYWLEELN